MLLKFSGGSLACEMRNYGFPRRFAPAVTPEPRPGAATPTGFRSMNSVVHFGEWSLFPGERRLECRGQTVKLGSRALDLLVALALRKGEVVGTRELMNHAWPKTVVTDASLRLHIWELRKALSAASPDNRDLILNVPGRGYLLADVQASTAGHAAAMPSTSRDMLVQPMGRVFGRDAMVRHVLDLVSARPIVTLVASGGMGKTTVARQVLRVNNEAGASAVWVDLSSVDTDDQVAPEAARAAGAVGPGDPTALLIQLLRSRGPVLLVLDCCERAVAGVTTLSECLIRQLPGLRIVATSREPLHAEGEFIVRLPPLEVGPADASDPVQRGPAVDLFIDRAQVAGLPLQLPRDLPSIARICNRLDGVPLAIELAAAHLVGFGVDDLAALIGSGFELGSLGRRTASERHKTLEATFEWSYQLLDEADRHILEWLAVFEGGASLQAILGVLTGTGLDPTQVAHGLARLVDKSLVKLVPHEAGSFYRLLDTTRAFAARRLRDRGDVLVARRSHAQYMLRAVSASQVEGDDGWAVEWFGSRAPNLVNLRSALMWSSSEASAQSLAIALAAASAPTFLQLSLLDECEQTCERALALLPGLDSAHGEEATRLMAYRGGAMLGTRGPSDETLAVLSAAQSRADEARDGPSRALALSGLFWLWIYRGEPIAANRVAAALYEATAGNPTSALLRDHSMAYASTLIGDHEDALARLKDVQKRSLQLSHGKLMRIGSDPNVFNRVFRVKTHWLRGEIFQARSLYESHLASLQKPEHGLYYCWALNEVVIPMHCFLGEWCAARAAARDLARAATRQTMAVRQHAAACATLAIDLLQGQGDVATYMDSVESLRRGHFASLLPWLDGVAAQQALARGQPSLATQLMDRAIAECDRTGSRWWLPELHRIHGAALLASEHVGDRRSGVKHLRRACEVAQAQNAAALNLSAAVTWGLSMSGNLNEEVRDCLKAALLMVPEMEDQPLAEQARSLLELAGPPNGEADFRLRLG